MRQIGVAVVGTGWCGGIRAEACAANPLVKSLDIAETRPDRLRRKWPSSRGTRKATGDYRELLTVTDLDAVYISATPETLHYPMTKEFLSAGKHVFLDKPIAMESRSGTGCDPVNGPTHHMHNFTIE